MRPPPRFPRLAALFGLLLLVLASAVAADIVVMRDGRRIEGRVVKRTAAEVVVKTAAGEMTFPRAEVAEIIEAKTRDEEYAERLAGCESADDFFALAEWCTKKRLRRRARKLLCRAIEIDPDHAGARRALGFVEHRGEWMTPEERDRRLAAELEAEMKAKGLVRFEGRWVTPKDKAHLEKGEVRVEGRWLSEAEAMRARGFEEFEGEWLPAPEARGRRAAAGAARAAGRFLAHHLNGQAMLCGTLPASELAEIGEGILRGRAWFDAHWKVKPGLALFGGQLAEFYVFDDELSYELTIPYVAARSRHIPRGWAAAVKKTFGYVWIDPLAIASAVQRNRGRGDLVGHCYHHLGHLMLNRLGYEGKLLPPWYDEGVAALTELEVHGRNAVFCRSGVTATQGRSSSGGGTGVEFDWRMMRDGSWRRALVEAVQAGRVEPFDKLAAREFGQLTLLHIATSMAIVEWLESRGGDALAKFHRALRRDAPPAPVRVIAKGRERQSYFDQAFRAAVGMDRRQADDAWRRWLVSR